MSSPHQANNMSSKRDARTLVDASNTPPTTYALGPIEIFSRNNCRNQKLTLQHCIHMFLLRESVISKHRCSFICISSANKFWYNISSESEMAAMMSGCDMAATTLYSP